MKLYTRGGDGGETGLSDGGRVPKDHVRVRAIGDVDELNAAIGVVAAGCPSDEMSERLLAVQSELFSLGAILANRRGGAGGPKLDASHLSRLEGWIDAASAATDPLEQFVLPGGTATAAALHVARAVCRRAERAVVTLMRDEQVDRFALIYLNRLSDLLFAWARLANHRQQVPDVPWNGAIP